MLRCVYGARCGPRARAIPSAYQAYVAFDFGTAVEVGPGTRAPRQNHLPCDIRLAEAMKACGSAPHSGGPHDTAKGVKSFCSGG